MQSSTLATTMVGYVFGVVDELERRGIETATLMSAAGLSVQLTNDPLNRIAGDSIANLLRTGARLSGDRTFGLSAARSMHPSNFHALGYGLLSSGSLLSFCERLRRFFPVISGCGRIEIEEESDGIAIATRSYGPMCAEIQANWQSFVMQTMRQVNCAPLSPIRVEFMHSKRHPLADAYRGEFRAPLHFGRERCAIVLSRHDLQRPLRNASSELADLHDRGTLKYLSALDQDNIVLKLQLAITEVLEEEHGRPSRQVVAERLKISVNQLQNRLSAQNASFQGILDQTRFSLAKRYLGNLDLTITEIGFMVGFSDSANFSRAFCGWSGMSPLAYRKRSGAGLHKTN